LLVGAAATPPPHETARTAAAKVNTRRKLQGRLSILSCMIYLRLSESGLNPARDLRYRA
jgi:hypothetical protein